MKVEIYHDKIIDALSHCCDTMLTDLAHHAQSYITEEKREYPRTTVRQVGAGVTGKIASSPRDVVDTGRLRDSFNITTKIGLEIEVNATWSTPYIGDIYYGIGSQPAYPYVDLAIATFEFEPSFTKEWDKYD